MQQPSIAVVIPCYNAEAWLDRAIDSALGQTPPPAELIVVDDGSTDGSVEIARRRGGALTLLTGPNGGACRARNRGLALAVERGADYVVFLDADDEFEGPLLAGIAEAASGGADIVFSPLVRRAGTREILAHQVAADELDPRRLFEVWLTRPQINPAAIAWRTGFLQAIGGWNEAVLVNQDGELVMRAMLHGPRLARNTRGRGVYNFDNTTSLSTDKSKAKVRNWVETRIRLLEAADRAGFTAACGTLETTLYWSARKAFREGWTEIGRETLQVLSARGYKRHLGSPLHRLAASVLGLERKVRLLERPGAGLRLRAR